MSKSSDELFESAARILRSVGKALGREAPVMRRAANRMVRQELPQALRRARKQARRRSR